MHSFGEIVIENGQKQMQLSEIGKYADQCWRAIPEHFPHVEIPSWIIMPDHIHGIIIIHDRDGKRGNAHHRGIIHHGNINHRGNIHRRDAKFCVSTVKMETAVPIGNAVPIEPAVSTQPDVSMGNAVPLENDVPLQTTVPLETTVPTPFVTNKFGPQSKNLASVIRGFKIGVTKYAKQHDLPFAWQTRYYDCIIFDYNSMHHIIAYIDNNVNAWENDR